MASRKSGQLPNLRSLKRRSKLGNSNSELGMTFSEHVGCILLEETSEQEKINELKTLFLGSDIPLVSGVVRGHTTFVEAFKPLMLEYNNLKLTSLLTDACMSEEFILKGEKLREEASQVIRLGFNVISIKNGYGRYCDITSPLSRRALAKKAYEKIYLSINVVAVFFLFYLLSLMFLDLSNTLVVDFLGIIKSFLFPFSIITAIMFTINFCSNYVAEYMLRRVACAIVYLQVMKLDEIVDKLFFDSK